jgi:hypothetical protein
MSSGAFSDSKYETSAGHIHPCRVQPETLSLTLGGTANAAPTGAVDRETSAYMSSSTRRLGVNARTVRLAWDGDPPDGYEANATLTVPILTPALFNTISRGTTGTYLGANVKVTGTTNEKIN